MWSATEYVGTQWEFEAAVMHNRTIVMESDIAIGRTISLLSFARAHEGSAFAEPLAGLVVDGQNNAIDGSDT